VAQVVEEFEHLLTEPEALSLRQCLRIAGALRIGFGPLLRTALEESRETGPQTQWELMLPILAEAERQPAAEPITNPWSARPRRLSRPAPGLTIRRERTRNGYCLHVTGPKAKSGMIDEVIEEIERMYGPG